MYAWKNHFVVQADYQHWANEVLFSSLDHLQADVIGSDQGLFFNSIHHTVDHLLLVSQSWLARLQGEQLAVNYKVINNPDWRELKMAMRRETRKLQSWLETQPLEFFDRQIDFVASDGKARTICSRITRTIAARFPPWSRDLARPVRKWISCTTGARWSACSTR